MKIWKVLLGISGIGSFILAGLSLYGNITGNAIGVGGKEPLYLFFAALALGIVSSYMFFRVRKK